MKLLDMEICKRNNYAFALQPFLESNKRGCDINALRFILLYFNKIVGFS